jgi:uncharacterized protein (DUF1015 family)
MVGIHPFPAVRPRPDLAQEVASVPYDVVTADEARGCIQQHPLSFLSVSRSDALLPGIPPSDPVVYLRARERFSSMREGGVLVRDSSPSFSLYRVLQGGMTFTGLVCTVETEDYRSGLIRRHELTRYDKEQDRTRHIESVNAQTGLVFLFYRDSAGTGPRVESLIRPGMEPVAQVEALPGAVHQVFRLDEPAAIAAVQRLFAPVDRLYIADGHHRAAAAVNVALARSTEGRSTRESGRFMAVLFSHERVRIHGYSRVVRDLDGHSPGDFLAQVARRFRVEPVSRVDSSVPEIPPGPGSGPGTHLFHMYLGGRWYQLSRQVPLTVPGTPPALAVTTLQEELLGPLLGISDPRGDPRLHHIGGALPLSTLEGMVDSGRYAAAFSLQPAGIETVMAVADAGGIMPPKSTWFEPKLYSGLVVHTLD